VAPAGYHYSALCAEDVRRLTPELVERATAGTFMGDHLIRGYQQVCERWPAAELPAAFFREVASDKPALFLSGERDPVTPPGPAARVAAGWPHSRHVVVPSSGHGQGGPCVGAMVLELVRSGSVEGIDTRCVSRAAPTRFEISGG
jgi:pimeloyl-ACP methyl ester carboxylesterase